MGKRYDGIAGDVRTFIERQHVFFVATAPLDPAGRVNLSPKGLDTFRILDSETAVYLDYVGSGAETIAHLRENGRIAVMFCAFAGPPKIVRLHGRGRVVEPHDDDFRALQGHFKEPARARAIIEIKVDRVSDSCGFGVPLMTYDGERPQLDVWSERKGPERLVEYQRQKNALSLDGLPALRWVEAEGSE